jgi:hypothetical protein
MVGAHYRDIESELRRRESNGTTAILVAVAVGNAMIIAADILVRLLRGA